MRCKYPVGMLIYCVFLLLFESYFERTEVRLNICDKLKPPYFGRVQGDCNGTKENGHCRVVCTQGFVPVRPEFRICNSSSKKWSPNRPLACIDRRVRCPKLRLPENGHLPQFCLNFAGSSCLIGCRHGYRLVGSKEIVCSKATKRWVPESPKCKKQLCPPLPKFRHARPVDGRCNFTSGGTCRFACFDGRHLLGGSTLRCSLGGKWTGKTPICVSSCPAIPEESNGQLVGECSPGIAGRSCYLMCKKGYFRNGNLSSVLCQSNGKWNSPLPTCESISCSPLSPPENGFLTGYCTPGQYKKPCLFGCNSGFKLNDSSAVYCLSSGNWSADIPSCKKITCPDVNMLNVEKFIGSCSPGEVNIWCNVTCNPGYRTSGNDSGSLKCLGNGLWSSSLNVCRKRTRCSDLQPPKNGNLGDCDYGIGGRCHQICHPDFVAEGPSYRLCLPTGKWDGTRRKCIKKSNFKSFEDN